MARPDAPLRHNDDVLHRRLIADRANASLARNDERAMELPLKTAPYANADLPAAADWEGALTYLSDTSEIGFSNGSSWTAIGGGGGGTVVVTTVTATTYNVAASDRVILVDDDTAGGAVTINLPAVASSSGRILDVKKLGTTGSVTMDGNAAETIDGSTTLALTTQYTAYTVVCDGTDWWII